MHPAQRPPRKAKRKALKVVLIVLGSILGVYVVIVVAGIAADAFKPKPAGPALTAPQRAMIGPNACKISAASEGGPWKMAAPARLCGMPSSDDAYTVKTDPSTLKADRFNFDQSTSPGPDGPVGTPASGWIHHWATPQHLGVYRFATVEGWTGHFNPKSAVPVFAAGLSDNDSDQLKAVDPGPHGGVMQCGEDTAGGDSKADDAAICVFATSTTIGTVEFNDTAKQLTAPANLDQTGLELRDALEVPAS